MAILFVSWLGCATGLRAQVLEEEYFNYAGTALHLQNGGIGWGGNTWTNSDGNAVLSNDGVSLAYPVSVTFTPSGSRLTFTTNGSTVRRLGTPMSLNANTNYYFSALVKRQGPFKFEFRDLLGNIRWRFGGSTGNDAVLGIAADTTVAGVFPTNETVFVICRMVAVATGNDQVFMSIYRAGQTAPALEPSSWDAVSTASASSVILTNLTITNMMAVGLEIDEIHIGRYYTNVSGALAAGAPVVTRQPVATTNAYVGSDVQFTVEVNGALPLSYSWKHGATALPNATNATLLLSNVQTADAGAYTVTISNSFGTTNSTTAVLNVILFTNVNVGMQAFWHLNETAGLVAFDSTANHNDGALINFAGDNSQWVPSDYNGGLTFGGTNYVEVPHSASLANFANRFSVAAWIRPSVNVNANGNAYRMLEKENTFFLLQGDGSAANLGVGGVSVLVKKAGANVGLGVGQALNANQWYHVAATFDGSTLAIYLDGVLKATRAVAAPIDTSTAPLHFGSDYVATTNGTKYFPGTMDEVGVWERPLQPSEILTLSGMTGPPVILGAPQPQTKYVGGSAVFQVRARGQQPLRYLWYLGNNEIRTATSNVLVLPNVQLSQAGEYRCLVANDVGSQFSDPALLTVIPVTNITDAMETLWKFEETSGLVAADSSAHGRNGALLDFPDATSQWVPGHIGGALKFDGVSSNRVAVASASALHLGGDASFAFWINPAGYGTLESTGNYTRNLGRVLRKGGYFDIETVDDPGTVRATIRVNGLPAPQNSLQTNVWQHFAVVFSGGVLTFYKDGFRVGDPVSGNLGATNTNSIVLGNSSDNMSTTNLFNGRMDEVGIWSRVLSESEILSLAGRDIAGPPVIVTQPQPATRFVGGSVSFLVTATGKRPISYQWLHDNAVIPNSNTNFLALTNLALLDAGTYSVRVQNDLGSAATVPSVQLTVLQVTNVASGLIAHWTFDETNGTVFADSSGHGHHAILNNATAVPGNIGMVGTAFNFDAVNDFAVVPNAPELNLADQASIAVWVNPRDLGIAAAGYLARIVRKDINFDFMLYASTATMRVFGLNKAIYDAPANSLTTNQWQHLALVMKDGTLQFFKNGRALANPVPARLGPDTLGDLVIGNYGPDLSIIRLFNGYMDDLGIWGRALTADEVDGIYQNGLVGLPLNATFIPFRIQAFGFTNNHLIRLVYSSPFTGRQHLIQRNGDFGTTNWVTQTPVSTTPLSLGWTEVVLNNPGPGFYRVQVVAQAPLFVEGFETGGPGWTHGGAGDNWEIGQPSNGPGAAFSGNNVAATSLTGNINPYSDCYLRSPAINLTSASRATLTFEQWRNVDPDPTFHGCIVNVLDASSLSLLQQLSLESGSSGGWQLSTLPLPPSLLGRSIVLEFRLYCDSFNLLEGWYVDDVKILPE